ncbi:MAG: carboxylating nicotinate-nucleotide diphosphorylase [Halobacteriovoraceae bacterium]|jgi:nicotinate-nucleotide pyrophosphorylase (carboxylating)|nr:carboxylating nicotinate-nucleotide diphosphorylase [Halobacteriovoraceae bacterium]
MAFDIPKIYEKNFALFFAEDDFSKNYAYLNSLPSKKVECVLKLKDDLVLAGLPFFFETFNYLAKEKIEYSDFMPNEGKTFKKSDFVEIKFELPFNIALTGERIALNLLQRASSVATYTNQFVQKSGHVKILDTRKTTPGLRFVEKYAVKVGGGYNHRFGQMDAWMIKDNHKEFFGGVEMAIKYFQDLSTFYQPLVVEIHDLDELASAYQAGAKHFLLDNFTPAEIQHAIEIKKEDMTYEVSGGISLKNIEGYILNGVDAISSGSLTYNAPQVDLSLKFKRRSL